MIPSDSRYSRRDDNSEMLIRTTITECKKSEIIEIFADSKSDLPDAFVLKDRSTHSPVALLQESNYENDIEGSDSSSDYDGLHDEDDEMKIESTNSPALNKPQPVMNIHPNNPQNIPQPVMNIHPNNPQNIPQPVMNIHPNNPQNIPQPVMNIHPNNPQNIPQPVMNIHPNPQNHPNQSQIDLNNSSMYNAPIQPFHNNNSSIQKTQSINFQTNNNNSNKNIINNPLPENPLQAQPYQNNNDNVTHFQSTDDQQEDKGKWTTGLCKVNCISCCCPCISMAKTTSKIAFFSFCTVIALFLFLFFSELFVVVIAYVESSKTTGTNRHFLLKYIVFLAGAPFPILIWMIFVCKIRSKIRRKYNINGSACSDLSNSIFCHCCSIQQMSCQVKDNGHKKTNRLDSNDRYSDDEYNGFHSV